MVNNWFVDARRCDNFSKLKGLDLKELIFLINNYYLEYRSSLGLSPELYFGVEVEYEDINKRIVDGYVKKSYLKWRSERDVSVSGGEVASPILNDTPECWSELALVCKMLRESGATANNSAAAHIHVSADILGLNINTWRQFLKIYAVYESILFRFFYGDKLNPRTNILTFAYPTTNYIYEDLDNINNADNLRDLISRVSCESLALNLTNVNLEEPNIFEYKNTIEFRAPNGTLEEIIWQNYLNTIIKLLLASSKDIDTEYLDYKLNPNRIIDFSLYSRVNLELALEFADLVFDNNLDKVYFLRQYLKDFEESSVRDYPVRARRFIK